MKELLSKILKNRRFHELMIIPVLIALGSLLSGEIKDLKALGAVVLTAWGVGLRSLLTANPLAKEPEDDLK